MTGAGKDYGGALLLSMAQEMATKIAAHAGIPLVVECEMTIEGRDEVTTVRFRRVGVVPDATAETIKETT